MVDRRRGRAAAVAVLAVAVLAVAVLAGSVGPAAAQGVSGGGSVTGAQFQALAERAVDDPRALAQLRAVQRVDGRPADVGAALSGAEGAALSARLRTLAGRGEPAGATIAASDARADAAAVLDGRRFKPSRVPRPFAGILRRIGGWLSPALAPVGRFWERVGSSLGAQIGLVAAVFVAAAGISARLLGRRSAQSVLRSRPVGVDPAGLDPDQLEKEAAAAEQAGELDRAVRLRFVAGVLRLDRAGVISYRSSMTTGQLTARLGPGPFPELATAFDEIAYGGRPAEAADVRSATIGWPRVLAEAQR